MNRDDIAIVGVSCRLPGGSTDLSSLWTFLKDGHESTTEVPADRWSSSWYGGPKGRPGKTTTRSGSFLKEIAGFDAGFFALADEEASAIDPQHRLLMELAIEALDDAGLPESAVRGKSVGVFIGLSAMDYHVLTLRDADSVGPNSHSAKQYGCPNRISNFLDLRGPSFSSDAACATSLVAFHLACRSLRSKECDAALCGAANIVALPQQSVGFSLLGTLAPDGKCKAFDVAADGYGRADGASVVVLKRVGDALDNGDRIYGIVRATGTSHGGRGPLGPWAPRHDQQAVLIKRVMAEGGVSAKDVSYVETHGTGTQVGDREEALALAEAIGNRRETPLPIGAVKRALGHSEASSGLSAVLKSLAMLNHGAIPGTQVETLRPTIPWKELGLRVVTSTESFPETGTRPIVGINSFGVGGSYAHVVLEAPPSPAARTSGAGKTERAMLVPASAKSPAALEARLGQLAKFFEGQPASNLDDAVHTLSCRRTHHDHRACVVASSPAELATALENARSFPASVSRAREVVFVFSGTGGQWWQMGRELLESEPVFRAALEEFDTHWSGLDGWSILAEMGKPEDTTRIGKSTRHSTAAQVALQVALGRMWASWGIVPKKVVGHSLGELAAAHHAGALTLRDLVVVTKARCDWQDSVEGLGTMAAVALSEAETAQLLQEHAPELDVVGMNAPAATTIAGAVSGIERICKLLEGKGVFCRQLRVTVPFHSRHIRERHEALQKLLPAITPVTPTITFVSAALGGQCDVPLDAAYWLLGFEQPVRFFDAVKHITKGGAEAPVFVELGPHPVLSASLEEALEHIHPSAPRLILPSLRRKEPERRVMLATLGALFVGGGQDVDWAAISGERTGGAVVTLPAYPWQHRDYWAEGESSRRDRLRSDDHPLTGSFRRDAGCATKLVGTAQILPRMFPILESYRIGGELLLPAAGYVEMMRAAANAALQTDAVELHDVSFVRSLAFGTESPTQLRTTLDELDRTISILSSRDAGATWTLHATARYLATTAGRTPPPPLALEAPSGVNAEAHYADSWARGYELGPHFQSLFDVKRSGTNAAAQVRFPEDCSYDAVARRVLALDALFQIAQLGQPSRYSDSLTMPVGIRSARFSSIAMDHVSVAAQQQSARFDALSADATMRSKTGELLASFEGVETKAPAAATGVPWDSTRWVYRENLVPAPLAADAVREGAKLRVALLSTDAATASTLRARLEGSGVECAHVGAPTAVAGWIGEGASGKQAVVVDLRSLEGAEPGDGETVPADHARGAWQSMELLQGIASAAGGKQAELVFVTARHGEQERGRVFGALVSLCRVAENEFPGFTVKALEVDAPSLAERVTAEILARPGEREIVWSGATRHTLRVRRLDDAMTTGAPDPSARCLALSFAPQVGFFLRPSPRRSLSPGDVRVAAKFGALSFRDTMKLTGSHRSERADLDASGIGDECMGIVTELGGAVTGLAVGDAVIVRHAVSGLTWELSVPQEHVFKKPSRLGDADAAGIPVAFSTAWYGLRTLAHLAKGERVLIHSAAGGVGLAAVQIAKLCGAEIFCTAGTKEKRDYLASLGVKHVFDSKDLGFVEAIRALTGERGLDVVLNSLPGPAMVQSLSLLGDFGRFVELGKRDLYENTSVGLFALRKNVTYHAVDLAKLWSVRPRVAAAVLEEVLKCFADGSLTALPAKVFPLSDLKGAYAHFGRGMHIGKTVIELTPPEASGLPAKARALTRYVDLVGAGGTYLVTGGLGGIGRSVVEWLTRAGATHIVVVGRSGISSPSAQELVDKTRARGVRLDVHEGSVTDGAFLDRVLATIRSSGAPLRGVVHLAGVLKDALLPAITKEDLETVFGAKGAGAWNLHTRTQADPLDFFLMFSSAASTIGSAGQGSYTIANGFLDWLARYRRSKGLPAQSLGLGFVLDVGMATEAVVDRARKNGVAGMTTAEITTMLDDIVPADEPHMMIRPMDWTKVLRDAVPSRFEEFRPAQAAVVTTVPLRTRIRAAEGAETVQLVEQYLKEAVARLRGLTPERLSLTDKLGTIGFDSLASMNLLNRVALDLGVTVAAFEVTADASIESVGQSIIKRLTTAGQKVTEQEGRQVASVGIFPSQRRHLRYLQGTVQENATDLLFLFFDVPGPVNPGLIEETLRLLTHRHEALRARFTRSGSTWNQEIRARVSFSLGRFKTANEAESAASVSEMALASWDISTECLFRAALLEQGDRPGHALVLVFNHLVMDQGSFWIVKREINQIYEALAAGKAPLFAPIPTTFADWANEVLAGGDDETRLARARKNFNEIVARGPKKVGTVYHSNKQLLPWLEGRSDLSAKQLVDAVRATFAAVTDVAGFLQINTGRTSLTRDLSTTLGSLIMPGFVPLPTTAPTGDDNADLEDCVAESRVIAEMSTEEVEILYARLVGVTCVMPVERGPKAAAEAPTALTIWGPPRIGPIWGRWSTERKRRVESSGQRSLPGVGTMLHLILAGPNSFLLAETRDETFTPATLEAVAADLKVRLS